MHEFAYDSCAPGIARESTVGGGEGEGEGTAEVEGVGEVAGGVGDVDTGTGGYEERVAGGFVGAG